jgi:hypothetical protein
MTQAHDMPRCRTEGRTGACQVGVQSTAELEHRRRDLTVSLSRTALRSSACIALARVLDAVTGELTRRTAAAASEGESAW